MSVFGVILVRVFPHSDWIREILRISPYSVRKPENTDQNNSEYGHCLRSVCYKENIENIDIHFIFMFLLNFLFENIKINIPLIFNEYFCITWVIRTRNVQTLCYIKPKFWLQFSVHESGLLFMGLRSWISGLGCWFIQLLLQSVTRKY